MKLPLHNGKRLYLEINICKFSSVSWDLYIVKNLFKRYAEEKYSEGGRVGDYLGKYFILLDLAQYL